MTHLYDKGPSLGNSGPEVAAVVATTLAFQDAGFDVIPWVSSDRGIDLIAARHERRAPTGLAPGTFGTAHLLGVQVKGGKSFFTTSGEGRVAIRSHRRYWSESTIPIVVAAFHEGSLLVEDPYEQLSQIELQTRTQKETRSQLVLRRSFEKSIGNLRARAVLGALYPDAWLQPAFGSLDTDASDPNLTMRTLKKIHPWSYPHARPVTHSLPGLHYLGVAALDSEDLSIARDKLAPRSAIQTHDHEQANAQFLASTEAMEAIHAGFIHLLTSQWLADQNLPPDHRGRFSGYSDELICDCLTSVGAIFGSGVLSKVSTGLGETHTIDIYMQILAASLSSSDPSSHILQTVKARLPELIQLEARQRLDDTRGPGGLSDEILLAEEFPLLSAQACSDLAQLIASPSQTRS